MNILPAIPPKYMNGKIILVMLVNIYFNIYTNMYVNKSVKNMQTVRTQPNPILEKSNLRRRRGEKKKHR